MSVLAPPVAAQGLTQRLRHRTILRGCTFGLARGTTALLGPNGAGKTVLLRTLAGITPAVAGRVWLDGGTAAATADLLREIAYVPQFPGAHARLTVRDHLERTARWHRIAGPRGTAEEAAERMGLARWMHVAAGRLGPAQRHRLALAEAWVRRARIVLFDEPTADLDPEERAAFWGELAELPAEAAVVTTHLFDEVRAHCRSALVLQGGRVRFAGGVAELAAAAEGCTFVLPPAAGCPPGSLVVGVTAAGVDVLAAEPLAAPERAPGPLDGYLHVLGVVAAAGLAAARTTDADAEVAAAGSDGTAEGRGPSDGGVAAGGPSASGSLAPGDGGVPGAHATAAPDGNARARVPAADPEPAATAAMPAAAEPVPGRPEGPPSTARGSAAPVTPQRGPGRAGAARQPAPRSRRAGRRAAPPS